MLSAAALRSAAIAGANKTPVRYAALIVVPDRGAKFFGRKYDRHDHLYGKDAVEEMSSRKINFKTPEHWGVYKPPEHLTTKEYTDVWKYVNSIYFGPERDTANFPLRKAPEHDPAVRLKIIPETWFNFMQPKTGVTGGYVLFVGLFAFLHSKEILIWEPEWKSIFGFIPAIGVYHYYLSPGFKKWRDRYLEQQDEIDFGPLRKVKAAHLDLIKDLERNCEIADNFDNIAEVKKEGVALQLETAYRQRLQEAYQAVKSRLDYHVEKEAAKVRFEQDHMVNWIVNSVRSSITPEQEKDSIKSCIEALKKMAAKQPQVAV